MSDKPREWTIEYDSNFDDHPPCVTDGPNIKPTEMEIRVIEKRAYDQSTQEIAALEALLEKCREALKDSVENRMVANQVACEKNYREILREGIGKTKEALAMLAEHKMKGSWG